MALKNRIKMGTAVKAELHEELKQLSEETRIPMSKLLDESIRDLILKHRNLTSK